MFKFLHQTPTNTLIYVNNTLFNSCINTIVTIFAKMIKYRQCYYYDVKNKIIRLMKSYQQIDLIVVFYLIYVNSYFDLRFIFYESTERTILNLSCQDCRFTTNGVNI